MSQSKKIVAISLLIGCLFSCSNSKQPFTPDFPAALNIPKPMGEAELMAICLSGEMTAPDALYDPLTRDLEYIHSNYAGSVPKVNQISFLPPWIVSCILVFFDDATAEMILQGEYDAWDDLNATYHVRDIKTDDLARISRMAVLEFEGRLHPRRLARLYETLPGVCYASPNCLFGDGPNVYPRITEFGITYLYRDAWGDCLSGCMNSEYWYFSSDSATGMPALVGYWNKGPAPSWFAEAKKNIELYRKF